MRAGMSESKYRKEVIASQKKIARIVYGQLGPLSERELAMLRSYQNDTQRRRYTSAIYGLHAGRVAWMEYLKWLRRKEKEERK